jgi:hypothetical protein
LKRAIFGTECSHDVRCICGDTFKVSLDERATCGVIWHADPRKLTKILQGALDIVPPAQLPAGAVSIDTGSTDRNLPMLGS